MFLRSILMAQGSTVVTPVNTYAASTADLNGSTQYFNGGNICNFGNNDFCYFGWIYVNTGAADASGVMSRYGSTQTEQQTILRYRTSGAVIEFIVQGSGTVKSVNVTLPSFDAWHFIYAQYDASAQEITISINDGSLATPVSHTAGINNGSTDFIIGEVPNPGSRHWDGGIGFIGAMPDNLTSGEITSVYNAGKGLCYDDLPSAVKTKFSTTGDYWHLAEFTGHTTDELTGQRNSLNLTNTGSTLFVDNGLEVNC